MTGLLQRLLVDGHEIRATKSDGHRRDWRVKTEYRVDIDGVHFGWLGFAKGGRYDVHGWCGWTLWPEAAGQQGSKASFDRTTLLARTYQMGVPGQRILLRKFAEAFAKGELLTIEQVRAKLLALDPVIAKQEEDAARDKLEREARYARQRADADQRRREMWDGLDSLDARTDLTNLERVALGRALALLPGRPAEEETDG